MSEVTTGLPVAQFLDYTESIDQFGQLQIDAHTLDGTTVSQAVQMREFPFAVVYIPQNFNFDTVALPPDLANPDNNYQLVKIAAALS